MARRGRSRRIGRLHVTSGAAAAVVLALAMGALVLFLRNGAQDVQSADDDAIAAGGRVGGGVIEAFSDLKARSDAIWRASEEIRALQKENAELREWKELALALSERQQRYEKLLTLPTEEFGQARGGDQMISARLILDPGGPFKRTLLANAGGDHGVKVGYVAMNENGLIGRVISVGRRSARVLLLDDYTSRVPVMGETSRARAMLIGQAGQKPRLESGPMRLTEPRLDYVVGQGGFRRGERVVTSGDGGVYPRGVSVGVAVQQGTGWAADLGAARGPIDYIRLIPPFTPDLPPDDGATPDSLPPPPQALYTGAPMSVAGAAPPAAAPRPTLFKPSVVESGTATDGEDVPGPPQ